jgi:hypothetical protein
VAAVLERDTQAAAERAYEHFALTEDALRTLYRRVLAARDEQLEAYA